MLVLIYVGLHIRVNEQFFTITTKIDYLFFANEDKSQIKKNVFRFQTGGQKLFWGTERKEIGEKDPFL